MVLLLQDPVLGCKDGLKILDVCSGTGCISLMLHALLSGKHPKMQILGVDISDSALVLARDNLKHNVMQGHLSRQALNQVSFVKADVLSQSFYPQGPAADRSEWDIVISNPPYISEAGFSKDTNRSVRNWEPKLALVPPKSENRDSTHSQAEDVFYYKILDTARAGNARIVLMEVGDLQQALRVAQIALNMGLWRLVEVWRDWPDQEPNGPKEVEEAVVGRHPIFIRGSGHGRSVLCRR
jgi:methylase of polypeptide subunit release factors